MKKVLSFLCIVVMMFVMPIIANAAEVPVYDATFNNGAGAFFANGTPITIAEDPTTGNTVATWDGGSQVLTNSTTVFGGGSQNSSYDSSNITMESGNVAIIYGGGFSTVADEPANIGTTQVTINGGTVGTLVGGGLLYTNVGTSNVVINNGTVGAVQGGGLAAAVIGGVEYSTGTEENPQDSLTRVDNSNVTINGGTISNGQGFGLVYGGGQGYSYTGNVDLNINGGDMSTAFVTAGGSNGYTGDANVNITGGDINIYQSVNRGQVNSADLRVTGGNIQNLYVGGETGDTSVTGSIGDATVSVVGGNVVNLENGTSGGQELTVDNQNYTVVTANGTVQNNNITGQDVEITYTIAIDKPESTIGRNQTEDLNVVVTTVPAGFENLFDDAQVTWTSSDENVAIVDQNGVVTGINPGVATITATLNDQTATARVVVADTLGISGIIIVFLVVAFFLVLLCV